MAQAVDALLDLVSEMMKAIQALSSVSEDHEFSEDERARLESEASGVAIALAMVQKKITEERSGRG